MISVPHVLSGTGSRRQDVAGARGSTAGAVLLAVILLVVLAGDARGQLAAIGAKGGLHWSDFTGDVGFADTDNRLSWGAGGFLRFALGSGLSIQPEVLWVGKGASVDRFIGFDADVDLELTYVEVPVLLRYDFAPSRARLRPYVTAGPYVAFELTCKIEGESAGVDAGVACDHEALNTDPNGVVFGLLGAVGVEIPLGDVVDLLVEGRASRDLTDVNDATIGSEDDDLHHRVFGLYIGVSVPFGRR